MVGRLENNNIAIYKEQSRHKLCNSSEQKQSEKVYITLFRGLSLQAYIMCRHTDCHKNHIQPCKRCTPMLNVATHVVEKGYYLLSDAFRSAFPDQAYKACFAIERFLQMPLASIRVGPPCSGKAAWFLVEFVERVDYVNFSHFAEAIFSSSTPLKAVFGKEQVKTLLGMACSNRERELLQYSVFKTSGLSATGARKEFGFERMKERASKVEECIEAARSIREAIDKLSCVEEKAILVALGLQEIESSDSDEDIVPSSEVASLDEMPLPSFSTMLKVVEQGGFNWFVVKTFMEQEGHEHNHEHLNLFYSYALNSPLSSMQKKFLQLHMQLLKFLSLISMNLELLIC